MADKRNLREQDSRQADKRPSDAWIPESQLPMPNPVPGWTFKYVRTASLGKADTRNVSKRYREGWVPVVASEHPELQAQSDIGSRYPDGIEIGGLLLCKMPTEKAEARNKYFAEQASVQLESVNSPFMNDQNAIMPKYNDSKSRTVFGKG